jgi:hypothetical protein
MAITDLLVRVADVFEQHRFRFMLIGGMAVSALTRGIIRP